MNMRYIHHLKKVIVPAILALAFLFAPAAIAGDTAEDLCRGSGGTWSGGSCSTSGGGPTVTGTFQAVTNVLLYVLGAIAVIMIIIGGIRYVTSNGEQAQVTAAKNTILYAVIGLVLAVTAYAIVNFVLTQIA